MVALKKACVLRDSVFDVSRRDTVLNLSHLIGDRIDAKSFFDENYVTDGMRTLLTEAFRRLQGKSDQALFKLTQAMGGGKTHNLITLGMLARHPEQRGTVLAGLPDARALPPVRVVAFSGRETDVPHGVWGEIAQQIGRHDALKDYYAPLRAPGRSAWINLLQGQPTLILLDELPPYLDNARSVAIGNSDLSKVTATALSNLFEAVAEKDLANVCIVMTDARRCRRKRRSTRSRRAMPRPCARRGRWISPRSRLSSLRKRSVPAIRSIRRSRIFTHGSARTPASSRPVR